MPTPRLRVAAHPHSSGNDNPYISLLYESLRAKGVEVVPLNFKPWRLSRSTSGCQIAHLHWPEYVLVGRGGGLLHIARAGVAAMLCRWGVVRLQQAGIRVVWTAHNLRPHDPAAPRSQLRLYRWLAENVDAVIVHSDPAADVVRERLGRAGPIFVAHHGNYMTDKTENPCDQDRSAARAHLGLSDDHAVLLAFGQIRRYKRLVELARLLQAESRSDLRLVVAGAPSDEAVAQELRQIARDDSRLVLIDRFIPDDELPTLFRASDASVLNYREVFSSGALLLSLSEGTAVLAPSSGTADAIADEPAIFTWDRTPFNALESLLAISPEARCAAARAAAAGFDWASSADQHLRAYLGEPTSLLR